MKTSISEIIATEKFLLGGLSPEDRLVFEAKLLVDDQLRANTFAHRIAHRISRLYHRKKLKSELDKLHLKLFNDPANMRLRDSVKLFKS